MTSSKPNYLPKVPPPNTITLCSRVAAYEFWGDTNVHSLILTLKTPNTKGPRSHGRKRDTLPVDLRQARTCAGSHPGPGTSLDVLLGGSSLTPLAG